MARHPLMAFVAGILALTGGAGSTAQTGSISTPVEKPVPPVPPKEVTSGLQPHDCDDAAKRAEIVALLNQEKLLFVEFPAAASAYSDQLMEWKSEKLRKEGWSKAEERKAMQAILTDPRFIEEMTSGFGEFEALIGVFESVDEKDELAVCRSVFPIQERFDGITRHAMAQWKIISDGLDAEAQRLGVSFE